MSFQKRANFIQPMGLDEQIRHLVEEGNAHEAATTAHAAATVAHGATGAVVGTTNTQSLSNKTLVSPILTTAPTAAGATWVDLGSVTTADINGGTVDGVTHGATNKYGGATHYSSFEADGTLVFNGDATVWEDLNFDPDRSGGPAVSLPDYVTINNVVHREFTSANNQLCGSSKEVPHAYKLDTTMYPHVHVFLKGGESAGTTGVTFTLYWELRQSTGTTSGSVTLSATSAELSGNAHKINIYDATGFAGPAEKGANLAVTIARTAGNAGDVVITTYGIHHQIDMVGSRTASTK